MKRYFLNNMNPPPAEITKPKPFDFKKTKLPFIPSIPPPTTFKPATYSFNV